MAPADAAFYRRWILANGWAEAAGLGTTLALGRAIAPVLADVPGVITILVGSLTAVLMGTLLEGVLVGWAQGAVLQRRFPPLPLQSWVVATAVGAGIAWLLGMIPSTLMALHPPDVGGPPPAQPSAWVQYPLAAALGLVTGPILGLAQWVVLRRHVQRAGRWLWANALAWGIGMPLVFLGMDRVPWNGPALAVLMAIYAVCTMAGLVVGAIHGRFLVRLVGEPISSSGAA